MWRIYGTKEICLTLGGPKRYSCVLIIMNLRKSAESIVGQSEGTNQIEVDLTSEMYE